MGKKSNVGAEDKKVGTVYFNTKDEIRLYNWVMDEAIPNGRYESFTRFVRSLIEAEWERQQMPASPPSEGRLATKIEYLAGELKQMKEEILEIMQDSAVRYVVSVDSAQMPVAPENQAALTHDFSQLVGEDEW